MGQEILQSYINHFSISCPEMRHTQNSGSRPMIFKGAVFNTILLLFLKQISSIREMEKYPVSAGLDKLYARWRACTQHAGKKVFACTKLNARKSIKKPFSSTMMFFKVVSCFCVRNQIIFGTIRTDIHRLFQLRSCCYIVISSFM